MPHLKSLRVKVSDPFESAISAVCWYQQGRILHEEMRMAHHGCRFGRPDPCMRQDVQIDETCFWLGTCQILKPTPCNFEFIAMHQFVRFFDNHLVVDDQPVPARRFD